MSVQVVFGAGQVGTSLALRLQRAGHTVRVVRRSPRPVAPGIEVVAADARDPAAVLAATAGADVIHHCMNPSAYTSAAWETEFPAMGEALIAAAIAHRARLVVLDNLYAYGEVDGPRTPSTPRSATGPKGRVRAAWDARLRAATADGLRWTSGRAGDFFGPGTAEQSLVSMPAVAGLARGFPALLLGDADAPHAFSYVPDVVEGLAALGEAADDVEGRVFHLPVHTVPPRRLIQDLGRALGRRAWAIVLPAWAIRALAPLVPLFANLRETLYQWDRPFLVDDGDFRTRFPGVGVTTEQAVAATAAKACERSQPSALPTEGRGSVAAAGEGSGS